MPATNPAAGAGARPWGAPTRILRQNLNVIGGKLDCDTASLWIKHYEQSGLEGLITRPRSGRNPIYTDDEIQQFKGLVDDDPRRLKAVQAALEAATGKSSCLDTLRRALKKGPATPGTAAGVR